MINKLENNKDIKKNLSKNVVLNNKNKIKENKKSGGYISMIAILISMSTAGFVGYSYYLDIQNQTNDKSEPIVNDNHYFLEKINNLKHQNYLLEKKLLTIKKDQSSNDEKISNLENYPKKLNIQIENALGVYNGKIMALKSDLQQLSKENTKPLDDIYNQKQAVFLQSAWGYVNLAYQKTLFTNDKTEILLMLELAGNSLNLVDSSTALKSDLKRIITMVDNSNYESKSQISNKIENLRLEITNLTMLPILQKKSVENISEQNLNDHNWKSSLKNSLDTLKSIVTITKLSEIDKSLLNIDAREAIVEKLSFEIQQINYALLENNKSVINESVSEINSLINNYYKNDNKQKQWLEKLNNLNIVTDIDYQKNILELIKNINKKQQIDTEDK